MHDVNKPGSAPALLTVFGLWWLFCCVADFNSDGPWAYLRSAVAAGEWWRFFSQYFVHANVWHWAVNAYAFFCMGLLWPVRCRVWLAVIFSVMTLNAIFMAISVQGPVVGSSGLLHGVFVFFAFTLGVGKSTRRPRFRIWLLFGIFCKLFMESSFWQEPGVAWMSHMSGAASGALLALAWTHIKTSRRNFRLAL